MVCAPAASPTACRWAANSNTWTAGRCRMRSGRAARCLEGRDWGLGTGDWGLGAGDELILTHTPPVDGEATANSLAQLARNRGGRPSRLARGVPLGGELEYVDRGTLSQAFGSRSEMP